MAEHPAAPDLAARLGRLSHTNARGELGHVHVPGFLMTTGTSPEMAKENGLMALAVAEGVIETLGENGYRVMHEDELAAHAQELADENAPDAEMRAVKCNHCQSVVFNLNIAAGDPVVDVTMIAMAIEAHRGVCE